MNQRQPSRALRVIVPIVGVLAAIGIGLAVVTNTSRQNAQRSQQRAAQQAPAPGAASPRPSSDADPPADAPPDRQPEGQPEGQPDRPPRDAVPELLVGLRAIDWPPQSFDVIGEFTDKPSLPIRLEFSPIGAGVRRLSLTQHYRTIRREEHVVLQAERSIIEADGSILVFTPMAAMTIWINGQAVDLTGLVGGPGGGMPRPIWKQLAPGEFQAVIAAETGREIARVTRRYTVAPDSYTIHVAQRVENLTDAPLTVRWRQFGPVDLSDVSVGYGGDVRRLRFGYLRSPAADPSRSFVESEAYATNHRDSAIGSVDKATKLLPDTNVVWPNERATKRGYTLVWAALTDRYWGVAIHPWVDTSAAPIDKSLHLGERVNFTALDRRVKAGSAFAALQLHSEGMTLPAGGTLPMDLGFYAGPLSRETIDSHPVSAAAGLDTMVVYNFGGPCAFCTFTTLTSALFALLHFLHDSLLFDWSLAIMALVLIVRTLLHPVTRWSQIRMQRFGKQMQAMAPKQKKVQERFKDDPKRMREEMAKLWREEGISPAGMLGCIPMFLQTPVWIALYATLFFAFELRHQPAFFGLFQAATGGAWSFLGDLAEPDRAWYFGRALISLPLFGDVSSLNVLPLVLGVVFYVQQKYLTPPTSATLTPEQEQQQKIMKVMMVVMFPLIMYNAPSGLSLYFIVNSTLGIVEARWIRRQAEARGLLDPKPRSAPKPGGFLDRLQRAAEQRQRQLAQSRGRDGGQRRPPPGRGQGPRRPR